MFIVKQAGAVAPFLGAFTLTKTPFPGVSQEDNPADLSPCFILFILWPPTKDILRCPGNKRASADFHSLDKLLGAYRRKSFGSSPSPTPLLAVADGRADLSQLAALCQCPELCIEVLGLRALPLALTSLAYSSSQMVFSCKHRACAGALSALHMVYSMGCVCHFYISFNKEVSLQNSQVCFKISCLTFEILHLLFVCHQCDTNITERAGAQDCILQGPSKSSLPLCCE